MAYVPIYRRRVERVHANPRMYTEADEKLAKARLATDTDAGYSQSHAVLKKYGRPNVLLVGASHASRLTSFIRNLDPDDKMSGFLNKRNVRNLSVGGSKLWSLRDNLMGLDLPDSKSYLGDQWSASNSWRFQPDIVLLIIGSNDADDGNSYFTHLLKQNNQLDYDWKAPIDGKTWRDELENEAVSLFSFLRSRYSTQSFAFIPIFPRAWWCEDARKLAARLNTMICYDLRSSFHIKRLNFQSVYTREKGSRAGSQGPDNIIPYFLEIDNIHLNDDGYTVLVRELIPKLMDMWRGQCVVTPTSPTDSK